MTAQAESNVDPMVGQVLNDVYRIEARIGEGGMGRVYRAVHQHLQKRYAVKVLSPERAAHPKAVERFVREARAASKIEHEHIAEVVNLDHDDDGQVYIVMELVEGPSLAELLKNGAMDEARACRIAGQIASALQAAHDAGIVHRDLKPENVLIDRRHGDERAKVLDFGISKMKSAGQPDVKLTATDQLLGTPLYISPELARGESTIDHRADIYALGAMLYEMLTGTPPFQGDNHFQLLFKHGSEAPERLSVRNPNAALSPHVEDAVMTALAKAPGDRFSSMSALAAALREGTAGRVAHRGASGLPTRANNRAVETEARGMSRRVGLWTAAATMGVVAMGWLAFTTLQSGRDDSNGSAVASETRETSPTATSAKGTSSRAPDPTEPRANPATATVTTAEAPDSTQSDAPTTTVRIRSKPSGARVQIDGDYIGRTPIETELPIGKKAWVRWSLAGFAPTQSRYEVHEGLVLMKKLQRKTKPVSDPSPIKVDF